MIELNSLYESEEYRTAMISCIYEDYCIATNSTHIIEKKKKKELPDAIIKFINKYPKLMILGGTRDELHYIFIAMPDSPQSIIEEMFNSIRSEYTYQESKESISIKNFSRGNFVLNISKTIHPNIEVMFNNFKLFIHRSAYIHSCETLYEHPLYVLTKIKKCYYINPKHNDSNRVEIIMDFIKYTEHVRTFLNPYDYSMSILKKVGGSKISPFKKILMFLITNNIDDFIYDSSIDELELIEYIENSPYGEIAIIFSEHAGIVHHESKMFCFNKDQLRNFKDLLISLVKERYKKFQNQIKHIGFVDRCSVVQNRIPITKPTGLTPWKMFPELYFILKNRLPKPLRIIIMGFYFYQKIKTLYLLHQNGL